MKREDLIKVCRYYHGEDECPHNDYITAFAWETERAWVYDNTKEKNEATSMDIDIMTTYIDNGLADFNVDDGVPITLKALLFFRLKDMRITAESFKNIYNDIY